MHETTAVKEELSTLADSVACSRITPPYEPIETTSEKKYQRWMECFGAVSPQKVCGILSAQYQDCRIRLLPAQGFVFIHRDDKNEVATHFNPCVWKKGLHEFILCPLAECTELGWDMTVTKGKQGQGAAKKVFSNVLSLIDTCFPNVERISGIARSVGSYAWFLFGFVPTEAGWDTVARQVRMRVGNLHLAPELSAAIEMILAQGPKAAWRIAEMDMEVADITTGKPIRLGEYLLKDGRAWDIYLDLRDPEAMAKFKGYLAKLSLPKSISVERAEIARR